MVKLVPCPCCDRHVHAMEPCCPFCARRGLLVTVSALAATTLAVGLATAACGGTAPAPEPQGGAELGGGAAEVYGPPEYQPEDFPRPHEEDLSSAGGAPPEAPSAAPGGADGGPAPADGPPPE